MRASMTWLGNITAALLTIVGAVMFAEGSGHAQTLTPAPQITLPVLAGDRFILNSRAVAGRDFHIHVRLPQNYGADPAMRYATVYVLDGDSLFPLLAAQHLFTTIDDEASDVIMVGIGYGSFDPAVNRRGFDYSMPAADARADQGGAEALAAMLREELIPAIEARYQSAPNRRILVGQSRGGHFAMWQAFTQPDLFWATIANSPTMRPGRARFFEAPAARADRMGHLIVASGSRDYPSSRPDFTAFRDRWSAAPDLPWRLSLLDIEGGTHSADIASVYRRSIRIIFPQVPRPPH